MVTNVHGLAMLARIVQIDAVSYDLRAVPCKSAECSNTNFICAIKNVAAGDGGVLLNDQVRFAFMVQFKMTAPRPERKRSNPIKRSNISMLVEPQEIYSLADRQRANVRLGPHFQARRQHERKSGNESALVDRESAPGLQDQASEGPR
ncbi:MAG: hypothetical protein WBP90_11205 [Terracidiphilus sp.]